MVKKPNKSKVHLANIKHVTISEIARSLLPEMTHSQAQRKLRTIRDKYTISRAEDDHENQTTPNNDSLVLWVFGFAITTEETTAGYRGNFARCYVSPLPSGKFTLRLEKVAKDLSKHPSRVHPPGQIPGWWHPVLRRVQKGRVFPSVEHIIAEFDHLQRQYPTIARRPRKERLQILVWERVDHAKELRTKPLVSYVFSVQPCDGGFKIHYRLGLAPSFDQKVDEWYPPASAIAAMLLCGDRKKRGDIKPPAD